MKIQRLLVGLTLVNLVVLLFTLRGACAPVSA